MHHKANKVPFQCFAGETHPSTPSHCVSERQQTESGKVVDAGSKGKPTVTHLAVYLQSHPLSLAEPLLEGLPHPEAKVKISIRSSSRLRPQLTWDAAMLFRPSLQDMFMKSNSLWIMMQSFWGYIFVLNLLFHAACTRQPCLHQSLLVLNNASGGPLAEQL